MTDEQILKQAIEKAVGNGWENEEARLALEIWGINALMGIDFSPRYYLIIFSHSFAKAFWGFTMISKYKINKGWQYHLHQMVLEENPLQYLEKYL